MAGRRTRQTRNDCRNPGGSACSPKVPVRQVGLLASRFARHATEVAGIEIELLLHPGHDKNVEVFRPCGGRPRKRTGETAERRARYRRRVSVRCAEPGRSSCNAAGTRRRVAHGNGTSPRRIAAQGADHPDHARPPAGRRGLARGRAPQKDGNVALRLLRQRQLPRKRRPGTRSPIDGRHRCRRTERRAPGIGRRPTQSTRWPGKR